MLQIISAKSSEELQDKANEFIINDLGTLTIINGEFFLTFMGKPKTVQKSKVLEEPKEEKPAPKKRAPRKKKETPDET